MSTFSTVLNACALLVMLVTVVVLAVKIKQMKRRQDELVTGFASKGGNWFRINVSSPAYFARRMKLIGFEAKGLLVDFTEYIVVAAEAPSGERIEKRYDAGNLNLQWIGNPGVGSANMHWFSVGSGDATLMVSADTGFNAVQSREAAADICRIIAPQVVLPEIARSEFALEKNKASLATVVGFFALLAYALVDGLFLNSNELIKFGIGLLGLPLCFVIALPVYWLLTKEGVPSRESLVLCVLTGVALALAYIPVIKRVDAGLSGDGAQTYRYVLKGDAKLEPVLSGPPPLNFRPVKEYWAQFEPGSIHQFRLVNGPLGLWQLDHAELDEKTREFYKKNDGRKGR